MHNTILLVLKPIISNTALNWGDITPRNKVKSYLKYYKKHYLSVELDSANNKARN